MIIDRSTYNKQENNITNALTGMLLLVLGISLAANFWAYKSYQGFAADQETIQSSGDYIVEIRQQLEQCKADKK